MMRTIAAAAALSVFGFAANATVINFDDATGGGPNSSYTSSDGFTFEPASSTGDVKCWDGKCLKEITQGTLTTMTYDADPADGEDDPFDLSFFYFAVVGLTTESNNSFTVQGTYAAGGTITADFVLGQSLPYTVNGATMTFAKDIGSPTDETKFENNVGYWVDLDDSWADLISVSWFINTARGQQDGQARLDCVGANEDISGAQSDCSPSDNPPPIPLPAAGWLLLAGVGGLAAMRRKKAA